MKSLRQVQCRNRPGYGVAGAHRRVRLCKKASKVATLDRTEMSAPGRMNTSNLKACCRLSRPATDRWIACQGFPAAGFAKLCTAIFNTNCEKMVVCSLVSSSAPLGTRATLGLVNPKQSEELR